MPILTPEELRVEQQKTNSSKRMKYGLSALFLFTLMDVIYGKKATLRKFLVLEIVARMPYEAWEHVSYVAITHTYSKPDFAKNIQKTVRESRVQQDNETWHLLMLEELLQNRGVKLGFLRFRVIPQILAWTYYHISFLMYVIRPKWSYSLNAQFEDHAEHEYAQYVADHPETDDEKWESIFSEDYGKFDTVGNLLRNISHDERIHKMESIERIDAARFSKQREKD